MGKYTHTFELSTNFSYALYHVLATVAHLKRMSEYRVCAIVANVLYKMCSV